MVYNHIRKRAKQVYFYITHHFPPYHIEAAQTPVCAVSDFYGKLNSSRQAHFKVFLIKLLHNFAKQAGDYGRYKGCNKHRGNGHSKFFYFHACKIYCRYVKHRFRRAEAYARAPCNIAVCAVFGDYFV